MEQGRRPDQTEYSVKANFYSILIAVILALVISLFQPAIIKDFHKLLIVVQNFQKH